MFFPCSATLAFLFFLSLVIPLVRITSSWDRPGRRAKGCLQRAATARTADRKRTVHILAMISIGRMRVMNKQKKKNLTLPMLPVYIALAPVIDWSGLFTMVFELFKKDTMPDTSGIGFGSAMHVLYTGDEGEIVPSPVRN